MWHLKQQSVRYEIRKELKCCVIKGGPLRWSKPPENAIKYGLYRIYQMFKTRRNAVLCKKCSFFHLSVRTTGDSGTNFVKVSRNISPSLPYNERQHTYKLLYVVEARERLQVDRWDYCGIVVLVQRMRAVLLRFVDGWGTSLQNVCTLLIKLPWDIKNQTWAKRKRSQIVAQYTHRTNTYDIAASCVCFRIICCCWYLGWPEHK